LQCRRGFSHVEQQRGDFVFDSSPHLVRVWRRQCGAIAVGPGAVHQPLVVVSDEGTRLLLVSGKTFPEIIAEDRDCSKSTDALTGQSSLSATD
jgi:hypothetical protein